MAGTGHAHLRADEDVLLRVEDLVVDYRSVRAVAGLSLDIRRGETLGLVGESGCGKSSTGRAVMMLRKPTAGHVRLAGQDLTALRPRQLRAVRSQLHMIFQDPLSSLNPRRTVRELVADGLSINRAPKPWDERVDTVLTAVGLDPAVVGDRRPASLSGGQCQRVAIARALVLDPALVICDEPVSALDVSIQAQILNLLADMKARYALTLLFIAHDLAVVKNISDRVAVMYLGRLCEIAPSDRLFDAPAHPYTRALLDAIPDPDRDTEAAPPLAEPETEAPRGGCPFQPRCPLARARCAEEEPVVRQVDPDHYVACHYPWR
jgi:peptide/nickel transport system ATP-binding protein